MSQCLRGEFIVQTDRGLFLSLIAVLAGFGALMVYSASITSWPSDFERIYFSRHLLFLVVGTALAAGAAMTPPNVLRRFAPWLFLGTVGLLILVAVPGIGTKVNGARRWLRFGPMTLQPSELAKIALPLLLAQMLSQEKPGDSDKPGFWSRLSLLVPVAIAVPLVLIEPDLGTAAFLVIGCGIALWAGGWPVRYFVVLAGLAVPAVVVLVSLKPYQVQRITGFISAWTDFEHAPYQLKQSLLSLGAGGTFGVGLGKGLQKLSFLPESNTDFVFAVIGEELGLVGTLAIAAIWTGVLVTGLRLLRRLPARSFESIAGYTLLMQLVFQAALNVAVVTALVPPKGISHPFLSAGGSNLVMSLVTVGLLLSLSRENEVEFSIALNPAIDRCEPAGSR